MKKIVEAEYVEQLRIRVVDALDKLLKEQGIEDDYAGTSDIKIIIEVVK